MSSVSNISRFAKAREGVKSRGEPASVCSYIPAREAGFATFCSRGLASEIRSVEQVGKTLIESFLRLSAYTRCRSWEVVDFKLDTRSRGPSCEDLNEATQGMCCREPFMIAAPAVTLSGLCRNVMRPEVGSDEHKSAGNGNSPKQRFLRAWTAQNLPWNLRVETTKRSLQ